MTWEEEFTAALGEWRAALDGFNYAEPEFVDYQVLRLYAAEQKLRLIIRQARRQTRLGRLRELSGGTLPPDLVVENMPAGPGTTNGADPGVSASG